MDARWRKTRQAVGVNDGRLTDRDDGHIGALELYGGLGRHV